MVFCSEIPGISCTGKISVFNLPDIEDFTLKVDGTGKIIEGQSKFTFQIDQNYDISGADLPGCNGKVTGSDTSTYTGNIPLPAIGGTGTTSATFYGTLKGSGNGTAICGSSSLSGSAAQTTPNVTLELVGFSPSMILNSEGKCVFSALDLLSSSLTSYNPTCTYRIENVTTLLPVSTKSP